MVRLGNPQFRFSKGPQLILQYQGFLHKTVLLDPILHSAMQHVHTQTLGAIVPALFALARGFGDVSGSVAAAVAENVAATSTKITEADGIASCIGNIDKMDKLDPIFKLTNPVRINLGPDVRIWRLIEYGTTKKSYPITARTKPRLVYMQNGVLRANVRVIHPGFSGKAIFAETFYNIKRANELVMMRALRSYVKARLN